MRFRAQRTEIIGSIDSLTLAHLERGVILYTCALKYVRKCHKTDCECRTCWIRQLVMLPNICACAAYTINNSSKQTSVSVLDQH